MAIQFGSRLKNAWNAFRDRNDQYEITQEKPYEYTTSFKPDRIRMRYNNERSIINSIFNRLAVDVAALDIRHVDTDKNQNGRFIGIRDSQLNNCLSVEANLDQTARALIRDICISMFDEGYVAVVPTSATDDPRRTESYDIGSLRVAKILAWKPHHVKVRIYNEDTGKEEDKLFPKTSTAIIENPFYSIMNEPNSILKRLIRKMNILDAIDEQSGSGKLDLIIQLPYVIKSEARRQQAEMRRKDIETQLAGSKYGITYTDGTERITQLNRPAENNLQKQIEYLTQLLYSQLGITQGIMEGSASEQEYENYYARTIEPIVSAIVDEFRRKWLTKTARTQGQDIRYFRDPFKLIPASKIAEMADKFTRNEILSSNEFRAIIGYKPSDDPAADELRNANLNRSGDTPTPEAGGNQEESSEAEKS